MGAIQLDPATSELAQQQVKADRFFTKETDGLIQNWQGNVWMNPPYAQPLIGQFSQKLVNSINDGLIPQAIVLVNNGTETQWAQILLEKASAICFPASRIRFIDKEGKPSGAPLQGQMFIYLGNKTNPQRFFDIFSNFGVVMFGEK
jgi:ParB family chromosome partitioning protein